MTHLLSDGVHLLSDGAHLLTAVSNCVNDCCGCLACSSPFSRTVTWDITGITWGGLINDCGDCASLNGTYGAPLKVILGLPTGVKGCGATAQGIFSCGGYYDTMDMFFNATYNSTSSAVSGITCCNSTGGTTSASSLAAYTTRLQAQVWINATGGVAGISYICWSKDLPGTYKCPFSGLVLPQVSLSQANPCNSTGIGLTIGVA
jgi:hypothetical protein